MPILTFSCPRCANPISFEYADYDLKEVVNSDKSTHYFEELICNDCGKKLKTVPWIAVIDEDQDEPITYV